jgi:hypothetical protein
MQTIYCKATDIYNAAVAGAKRGYNRSSDDYSVYEDDLRETFDYCTSLINNEYLRNAVMKSTKGKWQNAKLPLSLVMLHKHKMGVACETHARVALPNSTAVFDIPLTHWQRLCARSEMLLRKAAA